MKTVRQREPRYWCGTGQERKDRDRECQTRECLAHDPQHAVNCGVPLRLERHRPVERGKGDGEAIDDESRPTETLKPPRKRGIARFVLPCGHSVQPVHIKQPHSEVDEGTNNPERYVQVRMFELESLDLCDFIRLGPLIETRYPEQNRDEHNGKHGQCARSGFNDAPDRKSPCSSYEVIEHQE